MFNPFKKGQEVSNPTEVKKIQINSNNIASILSIILLIASLFGYEFNIDKETIISLSSGITSLFFVGNTIMTVISSKKVGL